MYIAIQEANTNLHDIFYNTIETFIPKYKHRTLQWIPSKDHWCHSVGQKSTYTS